MIDSDDSHFYIGEPPSSHPWPQVNIEQNLKNAEIGLKKNDDQETKKNENKKLSDITADCALEQTNIKCKLLKIAGQRTKSPLFHIQINRKVYFYSITGIRADHKIVLRCTNRYQINKLRPTCNNLSFLLVSEFLQQIIVGTPKRVQNSLMWTKISLDYSDPRVYDMKNYDEDSFEIGRGHKCTGQELDNL